ncbi:uncharacterized protein TNIN_333681 [Trichonephila inaurata madagascariensis]|uniref:Uncharacterized protein n=1 Tax=Trichonephila inaurata madagascariensis TaxID=2747483 RepID=A0A8X6K4Y2_9ARAC|nr:uncharacterized protein TNIN_333681 [Trichonephila inaurata madagascariensis]
MMTEVVTDASGRTTKINVPVKTTPNTLTGTTMVTEIVKFPSKRENKNNVPLKKKQKPRNDDELLIRPGGTTKIDVPKRDGRLRQNNPKKLKVVRGIPSGRTTKINVPVKTTPNPLTGTTMVTEIVTDSSGRTTKINVPLKISTPVNTESTTPEMMTEIVTDSSGRTTKINVPVKTTPNTFTGTTMVTEIVTDSSGRTTKINVPVKVSTPVTSESTTPEMMTEIVTDSSGKTIKFTEPLHTTSSFPGKSSSFSIRTPIDIKTSHEITTGMPFDITFTQGYTSTSESLGITPALNVKTPVKESTISRDLFDLYVKPSRYPNGEEFLRIYIPFSNIHRVLHISFDELIHILREYFGQSISYSRTPNGEIRIHVQRSRTNPSLFVKGPAGQIIRIIEELHESTPSVVTDSNGEIIRIIAPIENHPENVTSPEGDRIELVRESREKTPGLVTGKNGRIIRVILPDVHANDSHGITPVTVQGPHGKPIFIFRHQEGITPGVVTGKDGRIIRIMLPEFSDKIPRPITGPGGRIIYLIPDQQDTTPGAVTAPDGKLLYILLPEEITSVSSTPALVGPTEGLIRPSSSSIPNSESPENKPTAKTGNSFDIENGFPIYNGTSSNGTEGTGIDMTGSSTEIGPIPQNTTSKSPKFLVGPNFEPNVEPSHGAFVPPRYKNLELGLFSNPEKANENPLLTLKQFENIFREMLNSGGPRIKHLISSIKKARGSNPGEFNLRIFIRELSSTFADMRYENHNFNYSEIFIELMFETLLAALEIIRNTAAACIEEVTISSVSEPNISKYINAFFDILL